MSVNFQELSWEEIEKELQRRFAPQGITQQVTQQPTISLEEAERLSWDDIEREIKQLVKQTTQRAIEAPQLARTSYEDIARQLEEKAQKRDLSPWDFIKYSLASGVFRTAKDLNNAIRLAYEGSARFADYMTDLVDKNLYSPEKDKILNYLNQLVAASEETELKYAEKARTQNWLKNFIAEGLKATPEILTAVFLGTGIPGATGSIAKMIPFGTLAAGAHARNIEKEFEAIGKEAPYWKKLAGGIMGGLGEVATEMPVYVGVSKLLKSSGILNVVNKGAEKLLNTFGEKATEFVKSVLLEAAQEAEMEPIERLIKQTLGLPQDWSIASLAKDMTQAAKAGLSMALIVGGLGAGVISAEKLSRARTPQDVLEVLPKEEKEEAEIAPEKLEEVEAPRVTPEEEPIPPEAEEGLRPEIPPVEEVLPTEEVAPAEEKAPVKPSAQREIEYWQQQIEQDPTKVDELENYIRELAYGREAGEPIPDYFERTGLGEFYNWAQQAIEDYRISQAEAEEIKETAKEPWQMTYDEYREKNPEASVEEWEAVIDEALNQGKDVPWEIIASNPNLFKIKEKLGKEVEGVAEEATEAEMAEAVVEETAEEQHKRLRKAILDMGGIYDADYEDIPFYLKRKETGRTLDDIVDELREAYGFPVYTANDVYELIQKMQQKKPLYFKYTPKKLTAEAEMPLTYEPRTEERVTKTEIVKWAEKAFNVPLRGKVTERWQKAAQGKYYPKQQVIRMREWGELGVLAHEVAHHIEEVISKEEGRSFLEAAPRLAKAEILKHDYTQRGNISEGFAEFFRKWVSGQEVQAPNFLSYFRNVLRKYPALEQNVRRMQKLYSTWSQQGAEARIAAQIDWSGEHTATTLGDKVAQAVKFFQTRFIDEFYTIRKVVEAIEKKIGKELPPTKNPYAMATYYKAKAGAVARTFVMEKAIDWTGRVVGPGLKEILEPIPADQMKQFVIYAATRRAQILEKRGINSGFSKADIQYIINKYHNPTWDKVAKQITEWSNHLLDWLVNAGSIDPSLVKIIRDLNPIYVPFKRVFIEGLRYEVGTGRPVDTGRGVRRIKGSGRPIINPLESLVAYATEVIARAQKIHIARLFADLAEEYEGIGKYITPVSAPTEAFHVSAEQVKKRLKELGKDIPKEALEDLDDFLTFFTQDWQYNGKDYIVSIWRNGKRMFYEIHPELYEALKGVEPLRLDGVVKFFAPFARMVRLGATGLRVAFAFARNPFRDSWTYVVASKRKHAYVWDPIKYTYKIAKAKPRDIIWRFKALGGSVSGQVGLDRASTMRTYDELLLDKLGAKGKTLKVIKYPIDALSDIFSLTELGPRAAEIEAKYKEYTSEEWLRKRPDWTEEDAFIQAFLDAQDVTINFSRSGRLSKVLNQVIPFFNAAIQGFDKTYRLFKEQPVKTTVRGLAYLTTLAFWTWALNRDKDWYKSLPPAYKYSNLFFEVGDTVYRLPIPFELGMIFMAAPLAVIDTAKRDDEALKGLLELAKAQLPDVLPAAIRPIFDVLTNQDYLGRPIETEGMQYLYPTERKKKWTTKMAIALSKGLDKLGIKISPVQIDYLLDSYTGGFFRQVKPPKSTSAEDLPVLSEVVLRNKEFPRRELNEYFAELELLRWKKNSGIATNRELVRLKVLEKAYTRYRLIQNAIRSAEKRGDEEKLKQFYESLRNLMKKYGFGR